MRVMAYNCPKHRLLSLRHFELSAQRRRYAALDRMSPGGRLVTEGPEADHATLPGIVDGKAGSRLLDELLPIGLGNLPLLRRANRAFACQHPSRNEFLQTWKLGLGSQSQGFGRIVGHHGFEG